MDRNGKIFYLFMQIYYMEHIKCKFVNVSWRQRLLPRISHWTDERVKKVYAIVNSKLDDDSVIIVFFVLLFTCSKNFLPF